MNAYSVGINAWPNGSSIELSNGTINCLAN